VTLMLKSASGHYRAVLATNDSTASYSVIDCTCSIERA
jgi:hypothetical protein